MRRLYQFYSYGAVMNAKRKSDGQEVVMKFFGYTKVWPVSPISDDWLFYGRNRAY